MHIKLLVPGIIAAAVLLPGALAAPTLAQQPGDANVPTHPSNKFDDNRVTEQIRAALSADDSLSASAKNVEVATNQEAVILRGAVATAEDKDRIETVAGQYSGARQVDSQLTIRDSEDPSAHHVTERPKG